MAVIIDPNGNQLVCMLALLSNLERLTASFTSSTFGGELPENTGHAA